jgi:hypothetical protein
MSLTQSIGRDLILALDVAVRRTGEWAENRRMEIQMPFARRLAVAAVLLCTAHSQAQPYQWVGTLGKWSEAENWDPLGPPPTGATVAVDGSTNPFPYAAVDTNVNIANLTVSNSAGVGALIDPAASFKTLNVSGSTTVFNGFIQATDGSDYSLGNLTSQSNATLLQNCNLAVGGGVAQNDAPAFIRWRGANIVRNEGIITLQRNGALRDQDTGLDALRNFNQNGGAFFVRGRTFVTPGDFTNFGTIEVQSSEFIGQFARFETGGDLLNFDPGSNVLNGGHIRLDGRTSRAEFAFPGADIHTLAPGTQISLLGNAAILDSITGQNGLRNLGSLEGNFSVANALGLTPAGGTFQQVAGLFNVTTNGVLTITGNLQQFNGAITEVDGNGSLTITGNSTVEGEFILTSNVSGAAAAAAAGGSFTVESSLSGVGVLAGGAAGTELGGRVTPGSVTDNLDGATILPGRLTLSGETEFTQGATLRIGIAGTPAGTGHSQLEHQGPSLLLDGSLDIFVADGFEPQPTDRFKIVDGPLVGGVFDDITGRRVSDTEWFAVLYSGTGVTLALALPGDATLDGTVNIGDFARLAANFNRPGFDWTGGNFNGDSLVNIGDFALMAANFNRTLSPLNRSAAVPEPTLIAVLLFAPIVSRRRR